VFNLLKRFAVEDSGMEMLEWAIVAVLFAVAAAGAFTAFSTAITDALKDASEVLSQNGGTGS
jgi:Flp pilus assembly pilin Flp